VRVAVAARLAVALEAISVRMTVAIAVRMTSLKLRGVTEQRDEDHARDRHVVLERVEVEDESAEEREEREREAGRQRVPNQQTKPAEAREKDHTKNHARVQLAQEVPGRDDVTISAAVPHAIEGLSDVVGCRGHPRELKPRLALGLGEGRLVQGGSHGDDAVAAIGSGDDDAVTAAVLARRARGSSSAGACFGTNAVAPAASARSRIRGLRARNPTAVPGSSVRRVRGTSRVPIPAIESSRTMRSGRRVRARPS